MERERGREGTSPGGGWVDGGAPMWFRRARMRGRRGVWEANRVDWIPTPVHGAEADVDADVHRLTLTLRAVDGWKASVRATGRCADAVSPCAYAHCARAPRCKGGEPAGIRTPVGGRTKLTLTLTFSEQGLQGRRACPARPPAACAARGVDQLRRQGGEQGRDEMCIILTRSGRRGYLCLSSLIGR